MPAWRVNFVIIVYVDYGIVVIAVTFIIVTIQQYGKQMFISSSLCFTF